MTTHVPDVTPAPVAQAPPKNSFQRLAGVLFAPAETFADIARRPDFLVPLVVIMLVAALNAYASYGRIDFGAPAREAMEKQHRSARDIDQAVKISNAFGKGVMWVSPATSLIVIAVLAGIFLLAFRMWGGLGTYGQAVSITAYSWLPFLILSIVMAIVIRSRTTVVPDDLATLVRSNLGFLVDAKDHPVLFALATSIDVFSIWTAVLMAFGYSAMSGMSKQRSAAIVAAVWLLWIGLKLAGGVVRGMGS